jgi:hypothetical protein
MTIAIVESNNMYKVYIAKLKRLIGSPRCIFKVGITTSSDAMDRINYRGLDEPYPITNYFHDNKIMKGSQQIYTEDQAKFIERYIMDGVRGGEKYFHNWFEDDKISGITEMRKWNYQEFLKACSLMDEACLLLQKNL